MGVVANTAGVPQPYGVCFAMSAMPTAKIMAPMIIATTFGSIVPLPVKS